MRIKLKRLCLFLFALGVCLSAVGCRDVLSGCASWKKYSLDFVEAAYKIQNYQDNGVFTPETTLLVTFTEPEEKTEFTTLIGYEDKSIYFIFENLQPEIKGIKFTIFANREWVFDIYFDNRSEHGFVLYALDWNQTIYVSNTDITFSSIAP